MELAGYPSIDAPYTGVLYVVATSIYDSANPSFFNPGEVYVDLEGGVYRERFFDNEPEARMAFQEAVSEVLAGPLDRDSYSWPYDTISVLLVLHEYVEGLSTRSLQGEPFESCIVDKYDVPLQ